ncbi:hypothetical protein JOC85_003454 [Bacillus mesophilus]|nr:hypothetical protein [Bacillus mesophilus]MBM7662644.1 hypothetical protein [Bacillus mesophilus]
MNKLFKDIDKLLEATKDSETELLEKERLFTIDIDALLESTRDM